MTKKRRANVVDSGDPRSSRSRGGLGKQEDGCRKAQEHPSVAVRVAVGEEPSGGKEEEELRRAMDEKVGFPGKRGRLHLEGCHDQWGFG